MRLLVVLLAVLLLAGCAGSGRGSTAAPSVDGSPFANESPAAIGSSAPSPVGPGSSQGPDGGGPLPAPSFAPGYFLVSLVGPKAGAGEYHGSADILCVSTPAGDRTLWTATALPQGNDVVSIDLQANPSGWDAVTVGTRGQAEVGPWFARSDSPGETATVTTVRSGDTVRMNGSGTFTDTAGRVFTVDVLVMCSVVY